MNKSQDQRTVFRLTSAETKHFFILNPSKDEAQTDEDGYVMVFLSRDSADQLLVTVAEPGVLHVVVGMGEEKWALFQKNVPHRIVPLAAA